MLKTYIDTNVYFLSQLDPDSSSRQVLDLAKEGRFLVVQSDYLLDEAFQLFKQEFGKDVASKMRLLMISIPYTDIAVKHEWQIFIKRYKEMVSDIDDLPHICSYLVKDCDYFVTTNRRLTQMKIKDTGCLLAYKFGCPLSKIQDILL